jgi:integrase
MTPLSIPKPDDPTDKHSVQFLAYEYVEFYVKREREGSREVVRILKKDALPYWQKRDARTISSREIIERLDAIAGRGAPVMANRTAQILSQMFTFGIHRSIVTNSPVNLLFPPGGTENACDRMLSEDEIYRFIHGLPYVAQTEVRRRTLMVLLLTAVRRGSLAQAKWTEFDFNACEWHVPAEHDKERRSHIVPLTGWAVEELLALKRLSPDSIFVLPKRRKNRTDQPSSAQLISRSVKRLQGRFQAIGIGPFTPHDIRRTVRTQLAMLGTSEDIGERILNHSRGEIVNTYDLHKYVPEKRIALKRWECKLRGFLDAGSPNPGARELIRNWLIQNRHTRLTIAAIVPRMSS